jgi:hypothetical protein
MTTPEPDPRYAAAPAKTAQPQAVSRTTPQTRATHAAAIVAAVHGELRGLSLIRAGQAEWIEAIPLPTVWRSERFAQSPVSRALRCEPRGDGGWDASETLSVYRFDGVVPPNLVYVTTEGVLHALEADSVLTYPLETPSGLNTAAVQRLPGRP